VSPSETCTKKLQAMVMATATIRPQVSWKNLGSIDTAASAAPKSAKQVVFSAATLRGFLWVSAMGPSVMANQSKTPQAPITTPEVAMAQRQPSPPA
jgi:hypothetical protein